MDAKLKADFSRLLELASFPAYEREALVYLVLNGDAAPADLVGKTKIPKSKTYETLESLERKGFAFQVSMGKKRYRAARPEEFLPRLLQPAYDMGRLRTEVEAHLVEVYEGAQEMGPVTSADALVQVLTGRSARSSSLVGEFKGAKEEILLVDDDLSWVAVGSSVGGQLKAAGGRARVLLRDSAALTEQLTTARAMRDAGIPVRITDVLQGWFVVVDRRDVYVSVPGALDGPVCVHVRQPATAADLSRLFNQTWETARELT